jgi:hypothetical protein
VGLANQFLAAERDRWPLWLPVALGTGAGGYFALPVEPSLATGWIALGLAASAAVLAIKGLARWPLALIATMLLGFGLAKLREISVATPVLDHAVVAHFTGRIVSLEPRDKGVRVILTDIHSGALEEVPRRVRVALRAGHWVSGLPGAVSLAPAMPLAALLMISMGGLWLEIWRRGWRWWGLAPMLLGALWAWRAPLPDMLVAGDAVTIAIRGDDGLLHFVRKPKDTFAARDWLRRDGDVRDIKDAVGLAGLKCDGVGCVVKKKILIAASLRPEALGEDCARAQVVISAAAVASCKSPAVVIDQKVVGEGWRISLSSPPTAASVRAWRGDRPWAVRRAE